MITYYKVGGYVRDRLLGITSKDVDYAVEAPSFDAMKQDLLARGIKIFQERPEFLTIRGTHPEYGGVDYVLCRKDGEYKDGRHPESVEAGTIYDDLARRDFAVNAMASVDNFSGLSLTFGLIDPHNGQYDLKHRLLRCVGKAKERFDEDALRMLRAIRFVITKGFTLTDDIHALLLNEHYFIPRLLKLPVERIHGELVRCFAHDTNETLEVLETYDKLRAFLFMNGNLQGKLWLKPTLENK